MFLVRPETGADHALVKALDLSILQLAGLGNQKIA
jgi:hypothetical protein